MWEQKANTAKRKREAHVNKRENRVHRRKPGGTELGVHF